MFHTTQVLHSKEAAKSNTLPLLMERKCLRGKLWNSEVATIDSTGAGNAREENSNRDTIDKEEKCQSNTEVDFTYELQFCEEKDFGSHHDRYTSEEVQKKINNNSSSNTSTTTTTNSKTAIDEIFNAAYKTSNISQFVKNGNGCVNRQKGIVDLVQSERIIRGEIEEDALSMLEAFMTWSKESNPNTSNIQERATKLRLLQLKLQSRIDKLNYFDQEHEELLLNNGRRAWQAEVAMRNAAEELERQRYAWRQKEDVLFHRAVTFVIVEQKQEYNTLCSSEQNEWDTLVTTEQQEKKEAEHQAWVNFMNSPEQRALAAEKEREEILKRKKEARQARLHKIQQEKFINNCHHGRNGQSLFIGPAPQKLCGKCQVRYDDVKKCYVSMLNDIKTNRTRPSRTTSVADKKTIKKAKTISDSKK